jgi:tetratricopeptide (TPR) repeat protein
VDEGLDPLQRRDLITGPLAEPVVGDAFAYRHALLRDAGYASLARAERARLHVRLAKWMEGAAGDRTDEVAEAIAGHYAAALESAPRSGSRGRRRPRPRGRATFGRHLVRTCRDSRAGAVSAGRRPDALPSGDRPLLRATTCWASPIAGNCSATRQPSPPIWTKERPDYERSIDLYRQAAGRAGDESAHAPARVGLARAVAALCDVWYQQLRFADARDLADAVITELGELDDLSRARLLIARALGAQGAGGRHRPPRRTPRQALDAARRAGDARVELRAFSMLTLVQAESGRDNIEAWTRLAEMARRGERCLARHLVDDQCGHVAAR